MRLISSLAFIAVLTGPIYAQVPSYLPAAGLVGWWPFNGNADDESGNGFDGAVNGATLTTDRNAVPNAAFSFDGVNDDIITQLTTIGGNSHTISCWVRTTTSQTDEIGLVISRTTWNVSTGLYLFDNIQYLYSVADCSNFNYAVLQLDSLNDGIWHHYVGAYDGSIMRIYLDGVLVATAEPAVQQCISGAFTFGNDDLVPNRWFQGQLDDIGIWDRALTEEEIATVFVAGDAPCISSVPVSLSGLATSYSLVDAPSTLVGGPAGGVFIGPGVTGNTFDPFAAGVGVHSITYTYVDNNNCINTVGQCTEVVLNVGVDGSNMSSNAGVRVYPNPNRGQFTVELDLTGLVGLQVYDARGSLVHNEIFSASGLRTQRILDLSILPQGSYTLRVQHDGSFVNQTVVVE